MQLVKISEFSHRKVDLAPQITFATNGVIRVNRRAIQAMRPDADQYLELYLHFAYEGDKDKHQLYAWIDNDPKEGLKIRRKKETTALDADQHVCNAALLVAHFKDTFDWPLAKEKKPTIRYDVQPQIIKTEFSDRTFRLI